MCSHQDETYQRLIRAGALIDECYDMPLDLEQIAGAASFSRYHFIRLFRGAFDQTPHQHLIQQRIERAKALLAAGDLSVTEVCFAVGFQSRVAFRIRRWISTPTSWGSRFVPMCRWRAAFAG